MQLQIIVSAQVLIQNETWSYVNCIQSNARNLFSCCLWKCDQWSLKENGIMKPLSSKKPLNPCLPNYAINILNISSMNGIVCILILWDLHCVDGAHIKEANSQKSDTLKKDGVYIKVLKQKMGRDFFHPTSTIFLSDWGKNQNGCCVVVWLLLCVDGTQMAALLPWMNDQLLPLFEIQSVCRK